MYLTRCTESKAVRRSPTVRRFKCRNNGDSAATRSATSISRAARSRANWISRSVSVGDVVARSRDKGATSVFHVDAQPGAVGRQGYRGHNTDDNGSRDTRHRKVCIRVVAQKTVFADFQILVEHIGDAVLVQQEDSGRHSATLNGCEGRL